jgi:hypothetical protein
MNQNQTELKYFIHKHEVELAYGGPEEGGWWYNIGTPVEDWIPEGFATEDEAYERCHELNEQEHERRQREEDSYRSTHYSYSVHETTVMRPFPETRPRYE